MDIGKLKNNTVFYEGFEDEPEIELYLSESPDFNIHIQDGYFLDIFGSPAMDRNGWNGFTRDYNQMKRTYEKQGVKVDIEEYLNDLCIYQNKAFEYDETVECYNLLYAFLEYAKFCWIF